MSYTHLHDGIPCDEIACARREETDRPTLVQREPNLMGLMKDLGDHLNAAADKFEEINEFLNARSPKPSSLQQYQAVVLEKRYQELKAKQDAEQQLPRLLKPEEVRDLSAEEAVVLTEKLNRVLGTERKP